ncbi:hypothetical protein QAD02_003646 [Eretmocerus hayati]|uniref:Uncharacterized protein n=1 Tax=Eretmocerus hayati TaxID=131215 RepID=A0ACC2NQ64_9HYME|nr:hypothetical protein QAD02_003646 [Eretmocerus hayati]
MERMEGRIATQEKRIRTLEAKIEDIEARIKDYSDSESEKEDLNNNEKEKVNRNTQLMKSVVIPTETENRMEEKETKKATNKYKIEIRKGITWIREEISFWIRRVTGYGRSAYVLEELSKKGITTNKGAWVLKTDKKDLKDKLLSTMIRKGEKAYVVEEFMNATQRWKEKERRKGLQAMTDNGYTIKEEKGRILAIKGKKVYEMKWNDNINKYVTSNY